VIKVVLRWAGQQGSAALELTLITPVLVVLLLFVAAGGRAVAARGDVDAAARDAARAASITRDAATAQAHARAAAAAAVGEGAAPCARLAIDVDTGDWRPGGAITVSVTCDLRLADLALLRVPGVRTVTATASAPLDVYRGLP
jgi:Flp pilus assembly protein TadG